MSSKTWALLSLVLGAAVLWLMPAASQGESKSLRDTAEALRSATDQVGASVQQTVKNTKVTVKKATSRTRATVQRATKGAQSRATASDPKVEPPLHGSNDHGQGTVALIDISPSAERPLGGDPDGSDAGPEEVVVGRSRGEKNNGGFHGHITVLALFGSELVGVDSQPGQSVHGPLQPLQENVLDPLCNGSSQQVCLEVLKADSATTSGGSLNDFAVARAQLGGANGLRVGAAESQGAIAEDDKCQTSGGVSRTVNVHARGNVVAGVANSSSTSKSCTGQAPVVTNTSEVINLGGTGVGIPAPGCANGTPDTVGGIPTIAPIICNADEIVGAAGVRDALDIFVLATGTSALIRESTAASESKSTAPPEKGAECSDKVDNDKDGKIDSSDPGCHSDGNPDNPASYNPSDDSEADSGGGTGGSGGGGKPQCSDGRDNDGDGKVDGSDPGCHSDSNANNPSSLNPDDDDESDEKGETAGGGAGGGGGGEVAGTRAAGGGELPFTGTDVLGLAIAGLLMLAGGMVLRRRGGLTAR